MSEELLLEHLAAGDFRRAEAEVRKLIHAEPDRLDLYLMQGVIAREGGRRETAAAAYQQALLRFPDAAVLHHALGQWFLETGQTRAALAAFRAALICDPASDGFAELAGLAVKRGDGAVATRLLARAATLRPDLTEVRLDHANLLRQIGDNRGAQRGYLLALIYAPAYAEAWTDLGAARAEAGSPEAGFHALGRAVATDPQSAAAHLLSANMAHDCGRRDEADHAARRALALQPEWAEGWANRATLAGEAGDPATARRALAHAVAIKPHPAWTRRLGALS
ncbi:MAG: tetratricopeptide repeat protein [Alphaproteobacteria bacterium]|jgi:Tfp pilus assembly protein PilF|nr:tetratricopeptide repeat protein [Alphaproteobacteria bacterium]